MELKARPCLRFIGALFIVSLIAMFFLGGSYNNFKNGFKDGITGNYSFEGKINISENVKIPQLAKFEENGIKTNIKNIDISLKSKSKYYKEPFYSKFFMLATMFFMMTMLLSLLFFIARLSKGEIYEKSTYNSLIILGISMPIISTLKYLYECSIWHAEAEALKQYNIDIINTNSLDFYMIIGGLFVIMIAFSLRLGINIKEENDLTV